MKIRPHFAPTGTKALVRALAVVLCSVGAVAATVTERLQDAHAAYRIERWDTGEGLAQNYVHAIAQSTDGYLWMGTADGLSRFNGNSFRTFRMQRGAAHVGFGAEEVRAILVSRDGTLWVGSDGLGLQRLRNGRLEPVGVSKIPQYVRSLAEDGDGGIWLATGGGIMRWKDDVVTKFGPEAGVPATSAYCVQATRDGSILAGMTKGGVFRWTKDRFVPVPVSAEAVAVAVHAVLEDNNGAIWMGSWGRGLFVHENGRTRHLGIEDGLPSMHVRRIAQDSTGTIWVATVRGAARWDGERFALPATGSDRVSEDTFALFEDREKSLWVGSTRGLARLNRGRFSLVSQEEGLSHDVVLCVEATPSGALLIGTNGGGLNRLHNGRFEHFRSAPADGRTGFGFDTVFAVGEMADGTLLAGTYSGLQWVKDGWLKNVPEAWNVGSNVRSIHRDASGAIWVGTGARGLHRLRLPDQHDIFSEAHGVPAGAVRVIANDPAGRLWVGTDAGAAVFDGAGRFQAFTESDGLPHPAVRALHWDEDGILWVGTGRGLACYLDGRFHSIRRKDGLFHENIFQIVDDGRGSFWMTCPNGVYRATRSELLAFVRGERSKVGTARFGREFGLSSSDCRGGNEGAGTRTADGLLAFPTVTGVAFVDPQTLGSNPVPPMVRVETVTFNGKNVRVRDGVAEVGPGSGLLEIGFVALSYQAPHRVLYRYALEGVDSAEQEPTTRRLATYHNLEPGSYRFRVSGTNNDGRWSESEAELRINVAPFFYQTTWFKGSALLVGCMAAAGFYVARSRETKRREYELARLVEARTAELSRTVGQLEGEITERTRVEAALARERGLYLSLVESLPQNIIRKDADGRFTFANGHVCRLLNRPLDEIVGKTDFDFFPSDLAEKYRRDDRAVLEHGRMVDTVEENVLPDGRRIFVQVLKVPLIEPDGRRSGLQCVFWDITEKTLAAEALKRAQEQLVQASRRAGQADVAASVLHNVGNVLNSVNVSASLALERARALRVENVRRAAQVLEQHRPELGGFFDHGKGRALLEYLPQLATVLDEERAATVKELQALVDNIEHIGRIVQMQEGYARCRGTEEMVPFGRIIEDALSINAEALNRHGVELIRQLDEVPVFPIDKHIVLQILVNLIRNAKEAVKAFRATERRITVSLTCREGQVVVAVADNGIGIAPENLTRIFQQRFTTRPDGHGFGLHSSALAADQLGGSLTVQSDGPGRGATFTLVVPVGGKKA